MGTDVVGLDAGVLERAASALASADVVLAPTPDGGSGLIGMHRSSEMALRQALFDDMPWSTSAVSAETRRRAERLGATVSLVSGLRDVDVEADLEGVLPTLAVLIRVLDEAPRLERILGPLRAQAAAAEEDVELIVANGGSADGSAALARRLGARVIETPRGRGTQLAAAARAARARWLWTVHADARLAPDALRTVLAWCRAPRYAWAAGASRFDHEGPVSRLMECLTDGRPRIFRLPYGDQGLLVKRSAYEAVGGYSPIALMKEVALARALRHFPGPGRLATFLSVDARRWRHHGVLRTTLQNLWTLFRWRVQGLDAGTLSRGYNRGVSPTADPDTLSS